MNKRTVKDMLSDGPVTKRAHVTVTGEYDALGVQYHADKLSSADANQDCSVYCDAPRNPEGNSMQEGDILVEDMSSNRYNAFQQPYLRSNIGGTTVEKVADNPADPAGVKKKIAQKTLETLRPVGFCEAPVDCDAIGSKGQPVAVISGIMTVTNTSKHHITRGDLIIAGLPEPNGNKRKVIPNCPLAPGTVPTDMDMDAQLRNALPMDPMQELAAAVIVLVNEVLDGADGVDFKKLTTALGLPATYAKLKTFDPKKLQATNASWKAARLIAKNATDALLENKTADVLTEVGAKLVPGSAVLMSTILSRIMGVAQTDAAENKRFDIMITPTPRSLVQNFM
jgi:hypothetical protein